MGRPSVLGTLKEQSAHDESLWRQHWERAPLRLVYAWEEYRTRTADYMRQRRENAFSQGAEHNHNVIFESFPYGVAIVQTDDDSKFECLTALRKDIDHEAKKATYVWSLGNGDGQKRKHEAFHHTVGATPDATNFTVGKNSDKVEVGYFRYTDYKTCAVMELEHYGEQCILWVAKEVETSVPADCLAQYNDICGAGINVHDSDICVDDDDDSEDD
ncbi:hypothetical protein HPB50_005544 [Hyalomma asiaticum]|uniref:Uncharacterized protein n=1 Tax=Hyalomma asiaticum TaxID=266040 RepID=A0ACB7RXA8_HYAAI|nr:hypothetical protein HPB50_005544 [Hyalomma asiaticum]